MIQIIRSASLPWQSIDAIDERYQYARMPKSPQDEIDRCLSCGKAICTNCLDPSESNHVTGMPCGRPPKAFDLDEQFALWDMLGRVGNAFEVMEQNEST